MPPYSASNEYHNIWFYGRNKKKYQYISGEKWSLSGAMQEGYPDKWRRTQEKALCYIQKEKLRCHIPIFQYCHNNQSKECLDLKYRESGEHPWNITAILIQITCTPLISKMSFKYFQTNFGCHVNKHISPNGSKTCTGLLT